MNAWCSKVMGGDVGGMLGGWCVRCGACRCGVWVWGVKWADEGRVSTRL